MNADEIRKIGTRTAARVMKALCTEPENADLALLAQKFLDLKTEEDWDINAIPLSKAIDEMTNELGEVAEWDSNTSRQNAIIAFMSIAAVTLENT